MKNKFKIGEYVRVTNTDNGYKKYNGVIGKIHEVHKRGEYYYYHINFINYETLSVWNGDAFREGELVRVSNDDVMVELL